MEKQTNKNTKKEATRQFPLSDTASRGASVNDSYNDEDETCFSNSSMNGHDQKDDINAESEGPSDKPKPQAQQDKQSDEKKILRCNCLRKFFNFCPSLLAQKLTLFLFFFAAVGHRTGINRCCSCEFGSKGIGSHSESFSLLYSVTYSRLHVVGAV